jgi:hypothetical protein
MALVSLKEVTEFNLADRLLCPRKRTVVKYCFRIIYQALNCVIQYTNDFSA